MLTCRPHFMHGVKLMLRINLSPSFFFRCSSQSKKLRAQNQSPPRKATTMMAENAVIYLARYAAQRSRSPMSGIQSHPNCGQMCVPLIRCIACCSRHRFSVELGG
jgi:hypothetical protein